MNKINEDRSDGYFMSSLKRGLSAQRYEVKPPRVTHIFNTEAKTLKGKKEEFNPFTDQLVQYNKIRPYRNPRPKGSFSWREFE